MAADLKKLRGAGPHETGVTLGVSTTDLAGMHGAAAAQRAGAAQTAITDSTGGAHADQTLAAVGVTNTGDRSAAINDNFAKLTILLNEIRAALVEKGVIKGAA